MLMKKITIVIVAIVVVGLIAYFGLTSNKPTQTTINPEPIKIGIMIYPGMGPFYIAQEKGFFEKEGVKVEITKLSDEAIIPSLESNRVQMLISTPDFMAVVADIGIEAKQIFSTSISYGADGLVVKNDIQSISDLKGKKVYLPLGFPSHFLFRFLAEKAGLASNDVEIVNMNSEQIGSSFVARGIDAGMTWEPWVSKAIERKDGKVLLTSREYPGIITDTIMARRDLIENRREDVKRVMRAFFMAVDYWENNKDEGNAIVAKNFNLTTEEFAPMRETVKLSDYKFNLEKFDRSKPLNVYELTERATEIYLQDGIIKDKPDVNKTVDSSLLKELY